METVNNVRTILFQFQLSFSCLVSYLHRSVLDMRMRYYMVNVTFLKRILFVILVIWDTLDPIVGPALMINKNMVNFVLP